MICVRQARVVGVTSLWCQKCWFDWFEIMCLVLGVEFIDRLFNVYIVGSGAKTG